LTMPAKMQKTREEKPWPEDGQQTASNNTKFPVHTKGNRVSEQIH
jgi:hypothetical protein